MIKRRRLVALVSVIALLVIGFVTVVTGVFVTLLAAGWLRVNTQAGGLAIWALLLNGVLYVAYLAVTLLF